MRFARPRRPETVTLWVTLYFLLFCNMAFWSRLISIQAPDSAGGWLYIGAAFVFIALVFNLVLTLLAVRFIFKPVVTVLLLITPFVVYFMNQYGVFINDDMIRNTFQTDPREVFDLLSFKLLLYVLLLGVLPLWLLWRTPVRYRPWFRELGSKLVVILLSFVILAGIAYGFYKDFASTFRNNRELAYLLTPMNYIKASSKYLKGNARLQPVVIQKIGEDAHREVGQGARKMVTVLVVGETARAANFGLDGYERDTTPELAKVKDLVNFSQFTSCGTDTAVSVPCMFSGLERKNYDADAARRHEGLLDVVQRAGVPVWWRDNQSGCKGACDRVPNETMIATRFAQETPGLCESGECHDDILLAGLKEYIDELKGDGLIVLHMMGSHGPAYYKRYPKAFEIYTPVCNTNQLDKCESQAIVNVYDNTIRYTDHVLAKLIALLQKEEGRADTAMWYLSDHGESLGEHGLYLHGTPYMLAPSGQTHVPSVLWTSAGYRQQLGLEQQCLQEVAGKPASQDNLFHSMLGLLQVKTKVYNPALDLFAACRRPG